MMPKKLPKMLKMLSRLQSKTLDIVENSMEEKSDEKLNKSQILEADKSSISVGFAESSNI